MSLTRHLLSLLAVAAFGANAHAGQVERTRPGTSYRQEIPVAATGDTIVVQVFEPAVLQRGHTYPLVLHGHGYGGSRMTTPSALAQRLIDSGYYLISIDQRGFGESSGKVRIMSPDFEGQDLIAVLDWAENLDGLRRRASGEMVVGSYGGSYGGMYQFLLAGADPRHRLRVIAPDITPHDLVYALNPRDTVKSGWGLALSAGAEGLGLSPFVALLGGKLPTLPTQLPTRIRQDLAVYETLIGAATTNGMPEAGRNFLSYHSVSYFCDGQRAQAQDFLLARPDPREVAPRAFAPLDALITQGFRDTLFNFNDGLANYECLSAKGGDVRLLTHQSGHILPLSMSSAPGNLEEALDPFYAALSLPGFQDAGGSRRCGSLNLDDATYAWFEAKLKGRSRQLDRALPTRRNVCLSLAENDAIAVSEVRRGGRPFVIDASLPQFNSALAVAGSVLGNGAREALLATQPIYTAPERGAVLAGVPTLSIELRKLIGVGQDRCALPLSAEPCTPILFLGIGHRKAGQERWDLIDDQLTPIRGFGTHRGEMTGVAERLAAGDELALLVYGFHLQYPVTFSRYLALPAISLSGRINLPLLTRTEIVRDGV